MTFGYFLLSVVISIILFFVIGFTLKPSNSDGGLVLIIGIILSLQLSLITAILLNKESKKNRRSTYFRKIFVVTQRDTLVQRSREHLNVR
ncbi:hypothetical protein SY83_05605 [Paenibacillus swuensis]|uniref:Uncharacterized protein n=1 Tax=Paenibacillus swuensis TaxID=1178515 RepID=A0A172TG60_9BACL|nr:hypothetical protein SY83_05605 [Paenibacillus swuensis]